MSEILYIGKRETVSPVVHFFPPSGHILMFVFIGFTHYNVLSFHITQVNLLFYKEHTN